MKTREQIIEEAGLTPAVKSTRDMSPEALNVKEVEDVEVPMVIVGGGIVGLVLALALHKHAGLTVEIYEKAPSFQAGVGAGLGMYPNGLRVIRDIDPQLLENIQKAGFPYLVRRWERHDGVVVVEAVESALSEKNNEHNESKCDTADDLTLQPMGIRRWKLQKILLDAVQARKIPIYFDKQVEYVVPLEDGTVRIKFFDDTARRTRLLLGADGTKSAIRTAVADDKTQLTYTGTTCWYGVSPLAREERGICFPSSDTTKCHACFYPTGRYEQCFQFHIPTHPASTETKTDHVHPRYHRHQQPKQEQEQDEDGRGSNDGEWSQSLTSISHAECTKLADFLEDDGWHKKYTDPLRCAEMAIKVPFALLEPPLEHFVYGRIVLVGDAAHPPVPYLGQGAQQGLEDAGTLAMLFHKLCVSSGGEFQWDHVDTALSIYDAIRVPRTNEIIHEHSKYMGDMQQRRAEDYRYNQVKEEMIRRDVFFFENMPRIFPGAKYDYQQAVGDAIRIIREQENAERRQEQESKPAVILPPVPEEAMC